MVAAQGTACSPAWEQGRGPGWRPRLLACEGALRERESEAACPLLAHGRPCPEDGVCADRSRCARASGARDGPASSVRARRERVEFESIGGRARWPGTGSWPPARQNGPAGCLHEERADAERVVAANTIRPIPGRSRRLVSPPRGVRPRGCVVVGLRAGDVRPRGGLGIGCQSIASAGTRAAGGAKAVSFRSHPRSRHEAGRASPRSSELRTPEP